jgi:pyruvate dehydrogenase E1 component beta subunit
VDHKRLFPTNGIIPDDEQVAPLGKAVVRRPGKDVTIVSFSHMMSVVLQAAHQLEGEGISCEAIDLRSLAPLDLETVEDSTRRTGALLTVEEGQVVCGVGTELAFAVRERIDTVRVARLGACRSPVPSSPELEAYILPNPARVIDAVRGLLQERNHRALTVRDRI